jgi:Fic family protein
VRSSIARRLGLDFGGNAKASRDVEGVVEMMLDATQKYAEPLTAERLFGWHASLFPTGRNGMRRITVGAWRPADIGPMQVVSGPMGRERIHFEAPASNRLEREVSAFLKWFEAAKEIDPVLKAGVAHFWFVTSQSQVNERQRKVINRLLDGFEGKLSTSKYAKLAKCSGDTALRDIKILLDRGILIQDQGGGRNTSYRLVEPDGQS